MKSHFEKEQRGVLFSDAVCESLYSPHAFLFQHSLSPEVFIKKILKRLKNPKASSIQNWGEHRRFNKLQVIDYKPLLKIYGCLDLCHTEQIGKLIRIAAGCLMSPTQFFTPYFSNKKAVKYQPQPQQSLPSGCFFLQPSLKWFLAVYTSLFSVQMWNEFSDNPWMKQGALLSFTD